MIVPLSSTNSKLEDIRPPQQRRSKLRTQWAWWWKPVSTVVNIGAAHRTGLSRIFYAVLLSSDLSVRWEHYSFPSFKRNLLSYRKFTKIEIISSSLRTTYFVYMSRQLQIFWFTTKIYCFGIFIYQRQMSQYQLLLTLSTLLFATSAPRGSTLSKLGKQSLGICNCILWCRRVGFWLPK